MAKKLKKFHPPAVLPAPPQPSALEIRDVSSRILGHLVECLVDHIMLYHQSEAAALAALDFSQHALKAKLLERVRNSKC